MYVKWKGYDNSFNSWIDKANLVQRTKIFPNFPPYNNSGGNIKVELIRPKQLCNKKRYKRYYSF